MNFPVYNKLKACILNTFEFSEQYKKKNGSSSNDLTLELRLPSKLKHREAERRVSCW